jgi:YYY domain-containing protein
MGHLGVIGEGGDVLRQVFGASISRRLTNSWTALLLGIVLGLSTVHILRNRTPESRSGRDLDQTRILVMMMIGFGALLVLGPEFLYLKDSFGTRMNTIFKFYFAAWILWGLSAAYATIMLWPKRLSWNELVRSLVILPLVLGLVYPVLSLWTKTEGFSPFAGRTLDGMAYLQNRYPEEYEAMKWIQDNLKDGVIVEAIGGSYTYYGRISAHTGLTTLLGWPGHELQWRGGYEEQGSRQGDVEKLYKTRNWREAKEIVDRYGVDYVYIGPLERSTYQPLTDRKFESFMTLIYENGPVKIYATNEAT